MTRARFVSIVLFMLLVSVPALSAPVDINVGATGGYIWWQPSWADSKNLLRYMDSMSPWPKIIMLEDTGDFRRSSNFLGGPILSIGFLGRWSLSSVFLIGRYSFRESVPSTMGGAANFMGLTYMRPSCSVNKIRRDCLKWDSDSTVGCSVNSYFKIFAGFKAQGYQYEQALTLTVYTDSDNYFIRNLNDRVMSYGPALGVGLTVPLVENFYLTANFSGLVLWGRESVDMTRSLALFPGGWSYQLFFTPRGRIFSYGCNSTMNLGYYIAKLNTTVQVGGRYQLLFNTQEFRNVFMNTVSFNIIDRQYDHFFGVTMSVIYTFHIGKKEEES